MGDDEHGAVLHDGVHPLLDEALRPGVDGAGGLIQNQHRRAGDGRPGDGQKLPLPLGEVAPVPVEHGLIAVRQLADEGVRVGDPGGLPHLLVRGVQAAVADVVGDGPRKQVGVLDDHGQGAPQIVLSDVLHVDAVVGDGTGLDLVKPIDQVDDGGLSGSRGTHEGDLLPRLGVEGDAV